MSVNLAAAIDPAEQPTTELRTGTIEMPAGQSTASAEVLEAASPPQAESPAQQQAQAHHQTQQQPRPAQRDRGTAFAITSFVLGVASIVSGWFLVGPVVGLVLGVLALRRNAPERTLALWGVWMNAAMLALAVLAAAVIMVVFGFAVVVGVAR